MKTKREAGTRPSGAESEARRFVWDVLLPFVRRCDGLEEPGTAEVGALLWGFQVGSGVELSPFDVGGSIRAMISDAERSARPGSDGIEALIDVLRLVEAGMPSAATRFWYRPPAPAGG